MTLPIDLTPDDWTYSEYARLPDDGNRYEVLDGEVLVTPAPGTLHQKVVQRLLVALMQYVDGRHVGWVFQDVDLLFQTGQFLRPDLLVVARDGREGITDRGVEVAPVLVVEVLSPSSGTIDQVRKPRRYLDFGVPEYWVVDHRKATVWRWTQATGPDAPEAVLGTLQWAYPEGADPLELEVDGVVAPIA